MAEYMNYGYVEGGSSALHPVETTKHTQTYMATHTLAGARLPYMNRSFISFSYGGKNIEDFGLIAVTSGDRLTRSVYADFTDNITESDIVDGQLYWSSHFKANSLDLTLATDGITERQLDLFKQWFSPGKIRELVLAEHPNRGILARVAEPPRMSVLPFGEDATVVIGGYEQPTKTTLYKGEISLKFVMDDPYWYALSNILDIEDNGKYSSQWVDVNGSTVSALLDKDSLKVLLEDGNMISGALVRREEDSESTTEETPSVLFGNGQLLTLHLANDEIGSYVGIAETDAAHVAYMVDAESGSVDIGVSDFTQEPITINEPAYFYYGGTAPCAPIIQFTLTPYFSDSGYIISPKNSICPDSNGRTYNTIVFESTDIKTFRFTTPSIYTAYNQVIYILEHSEGQAWEDIKSMIRDRVKHYVPRRYAISVIDSLRADTTSASAESITQIINSMKNLFKTSNSGNDVASATFTINCKNGHAVAALKYRNENLANPTVIETEENVGDMILSNYLLIENRNYLSDDGYLELWSEDHPEYSYRVYADVAGGLTKFNMEYKFLYL